VELERVAETVSNHIRAYCGREFADASATNLRVYEFTAHGDQFIDTGDRQTCEVLVEDLAQIHDGVARMERLAGKPSDHPFNIVWVNRSDLTWRGDLATFRITGKLGWASIPPAIKDLAIRLASMQALVGPRAFNETNIITGESKSVTRDARSLMASILSEYRLSAPEYFTRARLIE